jgi:glycosyltransferase involved in cell wall biosynthesis
MRLIHLAAYGGAYPGSFIPMVRCVLEEGRQRGWSVEAVFSQSASERTWLGQLRDAGAVCHFVPDGHRDQIRAVRDLVAGQEPLILHTHFASFDVSTTLAARRRSNAIVFWHKHGALCSDMRARLRNTAKMALLARDVEEILCVAPNVAADARRCLAPSRRVALVPNAIDLERFPLPTPAQRRSARAALALPLDAAIVLHFGWDWERKGGDLLLGAIAALLRRAETRRVIALTVADHDIVSEAAQSLGIAEHVRALPPSDDVTALYAAADLFAAPSRSEGHPFAVAEAIASGLPVVASPIPGHEMIASSLRTCTIAPLQEIAFADAIAAQLALPAGEREPMQAIDRQRIVDEMDIRPWSERMLNRYEQALRRRSLL